MTRGIETFDDTRTGAGFGVQPPPGQEEDVDLRTRRGGFHDTKRVAILATLFVVGAVVIGYQFLKAKGPAQAQAKTAAAPSLGEAKKPAADQVAAILKQLASKGQTEANDKDGLTVAHVEELLKTFDTYIVQRQVPLTALETNPFEVVRLADATAAAAETKSKAKDAKTDEAAEEEARKRKIQEAASKLTLTSVMVVGDKRLAMISGKCLRVGDVLEGFTVQTIEPKQVTIEREGEKINLSLGTKVGS